MLCRKDSKHVFRNIGTNNVSKVQEIKQKKIDTCYKNFGVEFPMQSKEVMNKSIETNLTNYGVRHVSQRPDIYMQKKIKLYTKTFKYFQRFKEYIEPAFTFQQFLETGYHHQHWKCNKCGQTFYQDHYYYTRPYR